MLRRGGVVLRVLCRFCSGVRMQRLLCALPSTGVCHCRRFTCKTRKRTVRCLQMEHLCEFRW